MTDQQAPRTSGLRWAAYICGAIGILLIGLAVVQSFTSVALLDDPMNGAMAFLFMGFALIVFERAKAAQADQKETP